MSWSVVAKGTVEEVVKQLEDYGNVLNGQNKEEFEMAQPQLIAFIRATAVGTFYLNSYGHGVKDAEGNYREASYTLSITR